MPSSYTETLVHLLGRTGGPTEAELHSPRAFTLKECRGGPSPGCTDGKYDAAVDDLRREFRVAVREVESDWGPADFVGRAGDSEFPGIPFACDVAYWKKGECVACVYLECVDPARPVAVVLATFTVPELKQYGVRVA